ncbi:DUF3450 family protein [uncultured Algimonas sp.]|uniref:DUF3450 family protein n=1 Tax=uncultured Algimonas sp. TaxID=1547920 RepID=UPI002602A305|nr:DUF3450 family protein [uncultured Algimonas sp.]
MAATASHAQDADESPEAVPPVSTAPLADQYSAVLQEIADRRINIAQRDFYVRQQQAQIEELSAQIEAAADTDASQALLPMVREMVAEIEKVMVADLPFRVERRFTLLDVLREDLQGDNVAVGDAYRRAMELYGQEVNYGYQVGSYTGNNPIAERQGRRFQACQEDVDSALCDLNDEQRRALNSGAEITDLEDQLYDGNYIHFGRLALLYLERDSSEGYRFNQAGGEWEALSNAELLGLRQSVRIARGESAISTISAPIRIGEAGADAS